MTAHHEGAIEMAKLARQRGDHADVRTLADEIVSAQEREIATMQAVRDDMHSMGMHDGGHMDMSDHQGAVAMAEELLEGGEQPPLRKMANDIIGAQTQEIAKMKQWRETWYGSAEVPTT